MRSKWRVAVVSAVVVGMLATTSNAGSTGGNAAAATDSTAALSVETARVAESDSESATSQGMIGKSMELTAENEAMALYYNPQTTEIAVKNKKDGTIWFSNPQDREEDSKASGVNKSMLSSQLLVNFSDKEKTGQPQQYNSFDQSVKYGQFTQEKLDDGIR
ncbi:MAG: hypothetical protein K0Q59_5026, partial [Paenibacillus sp.]|nr:hypothetical protein [Paenibacillus sp.]